MQAHQIMSKSCRCSEVQSEKTSIAYAFFTFACLQVGLEKSYKIILISFSQIMM